MLKKTIAIILVCLLSLGSLSLWGCAKSTPQVVIEPEKVNNIQITATTGDVRLLKAGNQDWLKAVKGMGLLKSDAISTGIASEADLDIDLEKHLLVSQEVRMVIENLLIEAGKGTSTTLTIDTGSAYIRIMKKLNPDETFEIKTPNCIMGVRGTHFVIEVFSGSTTLSVLEGSVTGMTLKCSVNPNAAEVAFEVAGGNKITIPEIVNSDQDLILTPLLQKDLPSFVLKQIKEDSSLLPELYTTGIDAAITEAQTRELKPIIQESARLMDPFTGHSYTFFDASGDFIADNDFCESLGGHLMTITSPEEQAIAERLLAGATKNFYLIGLSQAEGSNEPAEGFQWITGEALTYTHWHQENGVSTEPNNSGVGGVPENFVTLSRGGTWPVGDWNDQNLEGIKGNYGFLCEWDQEARSMAIVANPSSTSPTETTTTATEAISPIAILPGPTATTNAPGTATTTVKTDSLGAPLVTVPPASITVPLKPTTALPATFDPALLTYENYLRLEPGQTIASAIALLGEGTRVVNPPEERVIWTSDPKRISIAGTDGIISTIEQAGLSEAIVPMNLADLNVRQRLLGCKTLAEVEALTGISGQEITQMIMTSGNEIRVYLWNDRDGNRYKATVDLTAGTVDHSF